MPNKTIYVRDADVPLFERASDELGESISALFASFLRERVATMTGQEKPVVQLIKRIRQDREQLLKEGSSKEAVSDFQRAEAYALKVLGAVRKQDYETARNLWFGAYSYHLNYARGSTFAMPGDDIVDVRSMMLPGSCSASA